MFLKCQRTYFLFFVYLFTYYSCVSVYAHQDVDVEVKGQPSGVVSFLLLCGFQRPNSGQV